MISEFHLVSMDKVSIKTVNEQIKFEIKQLRDIYIIIHLITSQFYETHYDNSLMEMLKANIKVILTYTIIF